MYKQFREIKHGEFFVVGVDGSQGGADYGAIAFLSKTHIDVPLVYHSRGVSAHLTATLFPVLERIYDVTGVRPVVAYEANAGGASEMERLAILNRLNKYKLYEMKTIGRIESDTTGKYGYSTNTATRPILLGDWKQAIDGGLVRLYDKDTIREHLSFVIKPNGKPEAEQNAHDDLIFAHAIAWQLFQTEQAPSLIEELPPDDTLLFRGGLY
jgi:hypothetical protein